MIEALAIFAFFSIFASAWAAIGIVCAIVAFAIIETINPDAPSCRQFWCMLIFPITIPAVIGYEVYKRYGQRAADSARTTQEKQP